jgi:hypothetical protein
VVNLCRYGEGTHAIEVRVADAYGAASTASTSVTVAAPPAARRALLQLQSVWANSQEEAGAVRRALLQAVPVTDYAELSAARVLLREVVAPAVKLGAAAQVGLYKLNAVDP